MKGVRFLAVSVLLATAAALNPASLISASSSAALAGLTTTKNAVFKASMPATSTVTGSLSQGSLQVFRACTANPGTTAVCGAAGVGLLAVAAPAVFVVPVLGAVGFGSNGVVLGSAAAGMQGAIGNVIAPSLFATFTSAGAGGAGLATVCAGAQVAGGAVAASAMGTLAWVKAKL